VETLPVRVQISTEGQKFLRWLNQDNPRSKLTNINGGKCLSRTYKITVPEISQSVALKIFFNAQGLNIASQEQQNYS
jgi:hypothetical protein